MKKLLICLSLLFSILFIDKVNAYNYKGVELNQEFFNKGWEVLNGTNNGGATYYQEDFPYVICDYATNSGGQISCIFLTDYEFWNQYQSSIAIRSENTSNKYVYAPAFKYYINNKSYVANRANGFYVHSPRVTNFDVYNGSTLVKSKDFDYKPTKEVNVNFHLNNGKVFDLNVDCDDFSCTLPEYKYTDFTVNLKTTEISNYIRNLDMSKETMVFDGWYYDEKLTKRYEIDDEIETDIDLYAKWKYKNTDDFLKNTNFIDYTFDTNYQYAIITKGANTGDVYLGLEYMTYNLELYEYDKNNSSYKDGATLCITPYYSKDDIYYYFINTELNDNIEVLVLPKEKLEVDDKTYYNFKLSDNAHITYSNDLKNFEIYDENDNKINTDIENSYLNSQESLINDENDLITIFKDLFKFKDNKVFQYFNQMWEILKTSDLYAYFIILIVGSLIILVIKSASRGG